MIPQFPRFKKLELLDKEEIERFTRKFPPYSDFNFVSLYSWNTEVETEISTLNQNLVVKFQNYTSDDIFYSFIGNTDVIKTSKTLLDHAEREGILTELLLIPEHTVKNEKKIHDRFLVRDDRDNFDYIYSINDLVQLRGKNYYNKANHLRNFYRHHPNCTVETIDITKRSIGQQMIEVFFTWEKGKNKNRQDTQRELKALERLISNAADFNLVGIGIYLNNRLIGFAIGEIEHNNYATFHFLKGDPVYKEIFVALYNQLAVNLQKKGIEYLNNEQDLGIEGLRQAKMEWRPVSFLKKYIITNKK